MPFCQDTLVYEILGKVTYLTIEVKLTTILSYPFGHVTMKKYKHMRVHTVSDKSNSKLTIKSDCSSDYFGFYHFQKLPYGSPYLCWKKSEIIKRVCENIQFEQVKNFLLFSLSESLL